MKIHTIDHHFFKDRVIASFLIENGGGPVLIETGPDTTFHKLEKSLNDLGYYIKDIRNVFVTHIHLDHSGAAWRFADSGARIHVHPAGAPHLADPVKLVASARRIYNEQMETLWGEIRPIARDNIHEIRDGEKKKIGNISIEAVETLGHASHHHSYLVDDVLFTGDTAGIRIENGPVLPPTPPPDINIELWRESIRKIMNLKPQAMYLTHFGKSDDAERHLKELENRLLEVTEWTEERLKQGKTEEEMIIEMESMFREILVKAGADKELIEAYELADPFWMNVGGLVRYWKKFRS
ncbi:MAG: MBL fold metallo-hydrolase [Thermodesulfobacteriota bacterium]